MSPETPRTPKRWSNVLLTGYKDKAKVLLLAGARLRRLLGEKESSPIETQTEKSDLPRLFSSDEDKKEEESENKAGETLTDIPKNHNIYNEFGAFIPGALNTKPDGGDDDGDNTGDGFNNSAGNSNSDNAGYSADNGFAHSDNDSCEDDTVDVDNMDDLFVSIKNKMQNTTKDIVEGEGSSAMLSIRPVTEDTKFMTTIKSLSSPSPPEY